jgi:hypothetical protein
MNHVAHRHLVSPAVRRSPRAFALPLVIVLSLVAGVMTAVILNRQSVESLTSQRELDGYRARHLERGIREVVGQWTDTLVGQNIQNMLEDDGHALDIQMADGTSVSIYLFDGQGSLLTDPMGLSENDRTELGGILDQLAQITNDKPDPMSLRPVGPIPVSLKSAPPEVLQAIAQHVGARRPQQFADLISRARAASTTGDISDGDLQTVLNQMELEPTARQLLNSLVTLKPTLLAIVIDVYEPNASEPSRRYGGRLDLSSTTTSTAGMIQSLGKFLSWEELPIRDEPARVNQDSDTTMNAQEGAR